MSESSEEELSIELSAEERKNYNPSKLARYKTIKLNHRTHSEAINPTVSNAVFRTVNAFLIADFLRKDFSSAVESESRHVTNLGKVGYVIGTHSPHALLTIFLILSAFRDYSGRKEMEDL